MLIISMFLFDGYLTASPFLFFKMLNMSVFLFDGYLTAFLP
jgi:hypothetical protein